MDFETYDMAAEFNFREDKLRLAHEYGYDHISEAIVGLYDKHKSLDIVGGKFDMSGPAVRYHLLKLGVKLNPKGGYHRGQ